MADESAGGGVADAMRAINKAWLEGRVDDIAPVLHPEIVMRFPGFSGQMRGRDPFLAAFRDFVQSATIHQFHDRDYQIDVVGDTAVITFSCEMVYTRSGERYRAGGRDVWIFRNRVPGGLQCGGR
jgi:ketosteroid isomerase-like protein